jgi:dienelactone hydrolase
VEIPHEHATLPEYFHRVDDSGRRRPLLIMHSGFDGSAEELHVDGGGAAVERGYLLALDGPGQFGPLHRENLTFRADSEKVVTPVVDFALNLPEVDPAEIALMGISLGGELAPRAAAFEKRISALIANDGVLGLRRGQSRRGPPEPRAIVEKMLVAKGSAGTGPRAGSGDESFANGRVGHNARDVCHGRPNSANLSRGGYLL